MSQIRELARKTDVVLAALARIETRQLLGRSGDSLGDYEFKISSQWGEDGIIQRLVSIVPIVRPIFVEFGVEDYREANTRLLLQQNYWSGLVLDGSEANIQRIKADDVYWRYNLKAEQAFVTAENINDLLRSNGVVGDIGILSIDIDGNDYWVWERIDAVEPRIVIVEYNGLFGPLARVSIPYDAAFVRSKAHHSNLYYGTSIAALAYLAKKKGYRLVGGNRAGNNAFFVRQDLAPELPYMAAEEAYAFPSFREGRDIEGQLLFPTFENARRMIGSLPLVDVQDGASLTVSDLDALS